MSRQKQPDILTQIKNGTWPKKLQRNTIFTLFEKRFFPNL